MKDIRDKLIGLLMKNYCVPQISKIARKLNEPSTTIHYNIKKMEREGVIKTYKAVFDYKKIGLGFCSYVLINISPDIYGNPEKIARELAGFHNVESVDIITGDWELLVKVRTRDIEEYYEFVKNILSRKGVIKIKSLTSLKQVKTEFVEL